MATATRTVVNALRDMPFRKYDDNQGRTIYLALPPSGIQMTCEITDLAAEIHSRERAPHQILLPAMVSNPVLKQDSKGLWGYTAGKGIHVERSGDIYTFDLTTGEIKPKGRKRNPEHLVRVYNGPEELSLDMRTDVDTRNDGRRFGLWGFGSPQDAASVVWQIEPGQAGSTGAAQNTPQSARRE